jgi:hypothetical protein
MIVRLTGWVAGLFTWALLSGCGSIRGAVYENYRMPYTVDLDETPVSFNAGTGKIIEVKEPFTGYDITAEFNSNAVGDIARQHGITKVYWADIEMFNLLGVWKEKRLFIYGE